MKTVRLLTLCAIALAPMSIATVAQTLSQCQDQGMWASYSFTPGGNISPPYLLTNGTVMVQYVGGGSGNAFQDWYALTPDNTGSYANGTWTELASLLNVWQMPYQYGPYGFASAILADGKLIVQGGEGNIQGPQDTNLGAIYDPVLNTWSQLSPPPGFVSIADAASVVLADDTYMVAACGSSPSPACSGNPEPPLTMEQALYNEAMQSWTVLTSPGNGKDGPNSEEGWTLLPGGEVLVVNVDEQPGSQVFNPTSQIWSDAGNTPVPLVGNYPAAGEIGPAVLLPNGTVFATGALFKPRNPPVSGNTAIYSPLLGWSAGPTFPLSGNNNSIGMGDEMAVLLPDGNVLLAAHDDLNDYFFYEYVPNSMGGGSLCQINNMPSNLDVLDPATIRMLVLPTGQVLVTYKSSTYYIYTPSHGASNPTWAPTITSVSNGGTIVPAGTFVITGTQFNGLSQANMFGDDFQNATNYPLVKIVDSAGHVFYARTHGHSTMGVATGTMQTTTNFDVPPVGSGIQAGAATIYVIANGISSLGFAVTIA